jgi:hypothetical protein
VDSFISFLILGSNGREYIYIKYKTVDESHVGNIEENIMTLMAVVYLYNVFKS